MMKDKQHNISEKALAAINHPQEVTFTVPLKLAVGMLALAEKDSLTKAYADSLMSMRSQIASQLKSS